MVTYTEIPSFPSFAGLEKYGRHHITSSRLLQHTPSGNSANPSKKKHTAVPAMGETRGGGRSRKVVVLGVETLDQHELLIYKMVVFIMVYTVVVVITCFFYWK